MTTLIEQVTAALSQVIDPELRKPITELDMVGDVQGTEEQFSVEIKLTVSHCPQATQIEQRVQEELAKAFPEATVKVLMAVMSKEELGALKIKLRGGREPKSNPFGVGSTTQVFLIGSGKGGVGKSSLTVNLAVELANQGFDVGVLDADIFGFSIPAQLGTTDRPTRLDDMILPPIAFGVKVISIGMFLPSNEPVAWRGPMLHKAVEQFLTEVHWGALDYLLIDMPPGTGDVAISVGQLLPNARSIVVTTPQQAASYVAERSGSASHKIGQEIFGVIENMSFLTLPDGSTLEIFGSGGGQKVADSLTEYSGKPVSLLAKVPISVALREGSDNGNPLVINNPEDPAALEIAKVAKLIANAKLPATNRTLKVEIA
jgi:ATP-binding protein involved in chromosome partitioning